MSERDVLTGDALIRQRTGGIPVPVFEQTAFVKPKPLGEATVAIVTTAGLQRPGDEIWQSGDQSYRLFGRDEANLTTSHLSNNFDRSGMVADLNVAYPLDRLVEMEKRGEIGAVAPRHVSFMGALDETMATLRHETAPEVAAKLREDGVDVVLLTPV